MRILATALCFLWGVTGVALLWPLGFCFIFMMGSIPVSAMWSGRQRIILLVIFLLSSLIVGIAVNGVFFEFILLNESLRER